jgi:succinate dehydrogenase/fumarate reductase flavoprotein subunit
VRTTLEQIPDGATYDLVVLGAGAAGMAAAVFGTLGGARVLLVERSEYLGGTSALSAGTTWIPNSMHAGKVAQGDTFEAASKFLTAVVGNHSPQALRDAFLRSGPEAIATLERESDVHFRPYATHPDYEQQHEGATMRGRALEPVPFDGRQLGDDLDLIRPPIPEFTIFGGMMVDRTDIGHLLNLTKTWASLRHAAGILGQYGLDRLAGKRGTRLVMGNALIGRMLLSLRRRKVDILTRTETLELIRGDGRVDKVVLRSGSVSRHIHAARGIVLAAGGFNRHPNRRAELLPQPTPAYSPAAPGHTGALQNLALGLGARFGEGNMENAFWAPVSVRKRVDGSTAVFPHFVMDRSKPGTVCVNQAGKRFVNESTSYHLFGKAMFEANRISPCIPCFIITDAVGLRTYGLGMVRMRTRNIRQFLQDGYLIEGETVDALARRLTIDPAALETTIADMNRYAETGVDLAFGRGTTPYHRVNGDTTSGAPNPTLGPIRTGPFYAVKLYPGDIGAAAGLVIDAWGQVLRGDDQPIGGLYACGNEANSIMGGTYPGPGITIGPAITFAYRAVQHALNRTGAADGPTRAMDAVL